MHSGSQSFTEREETASGQTSLESGWVFAVWKLLSPEEGQQGMGPGGMWGRIIPWGLTCRQFTDA